MPNSNNCRLKVPREESTYRPLPVPSSSSSYQAARVSLTLCLTFFCFFVLQLVHFKSSLKSSAAFIHSPSSTSSTKCHKFHFFGARRIRRSSAFRGIPWERRILLKEKSKADWESISRRLLSDISNMSLLNQTGFPRHIRKPVIYSLFSAIYMQNHHHHVPLRTTPSSSSCLLLCAVSKRRTTAHLLLLLTT